MKTTSSTNLVTLIINVIQSSVTFADLMGREARGNVLIVKKSYQILQVKYYDSQCDFLLKCNLYEFHRHNVCNRCIKSVKKYKDKIE